jgi:hypothetical protein
MPGAKLLLLHDVEHIVAEGLPNLVGVRVHHDRHRSGTQVRRRIQHVSDHGQAGHGMQDLGFLGAHPFAFASRQYYYT